MDKALIALSIVAAVVIPSYRTLLNHQQIKHDREQLTEMNVQMLLQIEEIARDIESMKNPRKVEHIIRDELGYGRKSDLTLVF